MNKFEKMLYYFFPPNDWILLQHRQDYCLVDHLTDGVYRYTDKKDRHYYIYYSKFRNLYKLEIEGYRAKDSDIYNTMINEVIRLNNQLNKN